MWDIPIKPSGISPKMIIYNFDMIKMTVTSK